MTSERAVRFLGEAGQHVTAFASALQWCEQFTICSAWASAHGGHGVTWKLLEPHLPKLKRAIIGIHFYQTEPWVLWQLFNETKLNLGRLPDGTFHPKVYLFENGEQFRALIGSANFTVAAFTNNREASVLICGDKQDPLFMELEGFLTLAVRESSIPSQKDIEHYEEKFKELASCRDDLNETVVLGVEPLEETPLDVKLNFSWAQYMEQLRAIDHEKPVFDSTEWSEKYQKDLPNSWISTAELCQKLIQEYGSLHKMSDIDRKAYCGTSSHHPEIYDPRWFGNMSGYGFFSQLVIDEPEKLDDALSLIPLTGTVSDKVIERYFDRISKLERTYTAASFRLLAMKRPDLFCSPNGPNREKLSDLLGMKSSELKKVDGFIAAHKIIWQTQWFRSQPPISKDELRCWKCRVALLDAICYE